MDKDAVVVEEFVPGSPEHRNAALLFAIGGIPLNIAMTQPTDQDKDYVSPYAGAVPPKKEDPWSKAFYK